MSVVEEAVGRFAPAQTAAVLTREYDLSRRSMILENLREKTIPIETGVVG